MPDAHGQLAAIRQGKRRVDEEDDRVALRAAQRLADAREIAPAIGAVRDIHHFKPGPARKHVGAEVRKGMLAVALRGHGLSEGDARVAAVGNARDCAACGSLQVHARQQFPRLGQHHPRLGRPRLQERPAGLLVRIRQGRHVRQVHHVRAALHQIVAHGVGAQEIGEVGILVPLDHVGEAVLAGGLDRILGSGEAGLGDQAANAERGRRILEDAVLLHRLPEPLHQQPIPVLLRLPARPLHRFLQAQQGHGIVLRSLAALALVERHALDHFLRFLHVLKPAAGGSHLHMAAEFGLLLRQHVDGRIAEGGDIADAVGGQILPRIPGCVHQKDAIAVVAAADIAHE